MRALMAKFLAQKFIEEFMDNQKMDLQTFASKVLRKFGICLIGGSLVEQGRQL
jgi:hypothetical protein